MDNPRTAKRTACDRCRSKRVRCQLAPGAGQAPCARCARAGAVCVTGAPGLPGRPRKTPQHPVRSTPPGPAPAGNYPTPQAATEDAEPPLPAAERMSATTSPPHPGWLGAAEASLSSSSWDFTASPLFQPDRMGASGLGGPGLSTKTSHPHTAKNGPLAIQNHPAWTVPGGPHLFDFPLADDSLLSQQPQQPPHPSASFLASLDAFDNTLYPVSSSSSADRHSLLDGSHSDDPFLDMTDCSSMPTNNNSSNGYARSGGSSLRSTPLSALARLRDKLDRSAAAMDAFLSDPGHGVDHCQDVMDAARPETAATAAMSADTPIALVLACTQEFTDLLPSLDAAGAATAARSTETTLLVLSAYLVLMRLYDNLFQNVLQKLGTVPADTLKSLKVKAVFRIGGMAALQDMSGRAYARGVVGVFQSHIQTLERSLGLPAAYCLSTAGAGTGADTGTGTASQQPATQGLFADEGRARLLETVMEQGDVRRDNKLYVEHIRDSIESALAFFED